MNASFYLAPWRLITLYMGTALLCVGADYFQMPDWDAGVSILMAVLCYLTAPWVVHVIRTVSWRHMLLAAFVVWVAVDYSYVLYNEAFDNVFFRNENFYASFPLYLIMGMFWYFSEEIVRACRSRLPSSH